jgi:hypothetical protein
VPDPLAVLLDKVAITEVVTRYGFAVDFRDATLLTSVFTPDATATYLLGPWGMDDVALDGRDAIAAWLASVLGNLGRPAPRHALTNHLVDVDGDTARSRSYRATGTGLYTMDHVRTAEGWRVRTLEMRGFDPTS